MARPSRHVLVLTLLAIVLTAAGCGSDPETEAAEVGEIVYAKSGVDTTGAPKAHVQLPSGRLDVRAGAPVESLTSDATRERTPRDAPGGGAFVPITWTFRTADMEKLAHLFGRPRTVEMTLVSQGERYKLPPPTTERDGERADAYYIAVEGAGEKATLEVDYAGETQSLDLRTGKRSAGRAAGLYDVDPADYSAKLKTCPSSEWTDFGPLVQSTFTCSSGDVMVAPFVDGEWAPEGKTFAVVGLSSNLTSYAVYSATGAGATYLATSSKEKSELDGKRPTTIIDESGSAGFAAGFLVFTLDRRLPNALTFHRTYQLQRQAIVGDVRAPFALTIDIVGNMPLS